MLGTVQAWHKGVEPPYAGGEVCDAYKCKKDAGVKVGKTGTGHKRQRVDEPSGAAPSTGSASAPSEMELLEAFSIVGHRLVDIDSLSANDVARREDLTPANYNVGLLVRGRFRVAKRESDPGNIDTHWIGMSELVAVAGSGVRALADTYWPKLVDTFRAATPAAPTPAPSPAAAAPPAAAATVAPPAAAAVPAPAPAPAAGFDGAAAARAAAATAPPLDHVALVGRLSAHMAETKLTSGALLAKLNAYRDAERNISATALSSWLGKARQQNSPTLSASIDAIVDRFLTDSAAEAAAAAAALGAMAADEAHAGGPVWRGGLPYAIPDERAAVHVLQAAHAKAGTFAIHAMRGQQWPPMPRDGGFCNGCGVRWEPGSAHFDPTNQLRPDVDPQRGPCLGWLCVRIRAAGGPTGALAAPTLPSEPYA